MIKVVAPQMAQNVIDRAMQVSLNLITSLAQKIADLFLIPSSSSSPFSSRLTAQWDCPETDRWPSCLPGLESFV